MALILTQEVTVTPDTTSINVKNTTGAYTINNVGGFGAPNVERNSVALVCYTTYHPYDLDVINLSFEPSVSENVIEYSVAFENTEEDVFSIDYYKDGWYTISMIAVPTSNGAPVLNDIIYNTGTGVLQIYNGSAFVAMTATDWEYLLDSDKYDLVTEKILYQQNLVTQQKCQLEKYIACLFCDACKCEDIEHTLYKLESFIQSADYWFATGKEYEAQRMVELMTKQYKCCS